MSPREKPRKTVLALAALALIAAAYFPVLFVSRSSPLSQLPAADLLLPNLWLIVSGLFFVRMFKMGFVLEHGGRRKLAGIVPVTILLAAILAMSHWWPDRSRTPAYATLIEKLFVIILVPLAEEIFFRGILLDRISSLLRSRVAAALLVSVLFALVHYPQGATVAVTMGVLSAFLCASVLLTESLLWPVAIHVGWNALSVIRETPPGMDRWIPAAFAVAVLIVIILRGVHTRTNSQRTG